ncbi:Pyridoxine 5'-phosphate synthase [Nymphon striatum]|nr:Pyridoxine 5'-phosphate synthase [Nymphon striatum]
MTKLSVNINKIATLRNARGGNAPNLLKVASDIESFGAQGITIHPRPDERHIRNPNAKFIDLVLETKPTQVTWYQTPLTAITSNAGWDTIRHQAFLKDVINTFQQNWSRTYLRVSLFRPRECSQNVLRQAEMKQLLHSRIIGEGDPLVILHGFLGMSDNWKTLGNHYAEKGYQLAPIVLLGHSMGGKTAMQFACDFSELTKKLIVADIAPKFYPPHHQDIINGLQSLNFETISSRGEADIELSKHLNHIGIRQFLLKNLYWIEKGKLAFRFNLPVLSTKMEEIGENISNAASYDGPTLFLKGDKSEYVIAADMPEIKKHFPNAILETIDNAGHWLHAENPKQFFEKSMIFLNS